MFVNGRMTLRSNNSVSPTKAALATQQPALPQLRLQLHRCDSPAATVEDTPEEEEVAPPPQVPTPVPRTRTPAPRRPDLEVSRLGGILAELDALFAEASSLADSREWSEDDVEAVQAIRISRQDQQKLYKSPSGASLIVFFPELFQKSDNAAVAQPAGNAASPKRKKRRNRKKKQTTSAPARPAASEKTQKRKDERSGNLANHRRAPPQRPAAAFKGHHRDLPENRKLLARARRDREDFCLRVYGFRNNVERLKALIANRPADYRPIRKSSITK